MTHRSHFQPSTLWLLAFALLITWLAPSYATAQGILPAEGNLKFRVGDDTRSPVVVLIDKGLIYEGERKSEDAVLFNFRRDLGREGRERSGDYLLRIRNNRVVDPDNNTVFTVSNGKIYGPDDRRTVLYTVGGSKIYQGDNRQGEPLYTWSGKSWNNQQTALIFAVLIALEAIPAEPDIQVDTAVDSDADAF